LIAAAISPGIRDVVETFRRNILGVWNCH